MAWSPFRLSNTVFVFCRRVRRPKCRIARSDDRATDDVVDFAIERARLCGYPVAQRSAQNRTFDIKCTVRPRWQRMAAEGSHYLLYALMLSMPLIGWGMLSAEPYPVVLAGPLHLPPILPQNATLYAWLRQLHTVLAYLFFLTFLAHFGAALLHGLVRRDGVFESMASFGRSSPRRP